MELQELCSARATVWGYAKDQDGRLERGSEHEPLKILFKPRIRPKSRLPVHHYTVKMMQDKLILGTVQKLDRKRKQIQNDSLKQNYHQNFT